MSDKIDDEIDHEYTKEIVCPRCGYEHGDSWEKHMADGDEHKMDCDNCGKPFIVTCTVTVDYSTVTA